MNRPHCGGTIKITDAQKSCMSYIMLSFTLYMIIAVNHMRVSSVCLIKHVIEFVITWLQITTWQI